MIEGGPDRRTMLKGLVMAGAGVLGVGSARGEAAPIAQRAAVTQKNVSVPDREYWVEMMRKVSEPLLMAMQARKLVASMPVEGRPGEVAERRKNTHLEAVGRLLAGIAPWLEHGPRANSEGQGGAEGALRERFAKAAREGLESGVDPASPDYLHFGATPQSLVDAAFLGLAILRAPNELWAKLPVTVKKNVVRGLVATRNITPYENNWVLFAAMVEITLRSAGERWEKKRVDYALRQHERWYSGDGIYGDGPEFHWDYYNSFVIQPFLMQIMDSAADEDVAWRAMRGKIEARAVRYGAIQERLISPEGTFPAIGRSLAYRCGAFHHLADISLRQKLSQGVAPEQVRSALTAVMRRSLGVAGTFDAKGWLTIGFAGHQPDVAENYISTGSLYLCSLVFLPLGLKADNRFWAGPTTKWSSQKQWGGLDFAADHALNGTDH